MSASYIRRMIKRMAEPRITTVAQGRVGMLQTVNPATGEPALIPRATAGRWVTASTVNETDTNAIATGGYH